MISITVLGSGPAIAIPRAGCRCKTCQEARKPKSRSRRRRSSILINFGNHNILIDCGPDILEQMEMAGFRRVEAVLLTHAHADAAGGVDIFASILREEKEKPFLLYAEQNVLKRVLKISALVHARSKTVLQNIVPKPIKPGVPFSLFGIEIVPLRVSHAITPGFPTVGYLFEKKFAYISDCSKIPPKSFKALRGVKILILDAAMWFRTKIVVHQNTEQAIGIAQKLGVRKLYLTQIGHTYPPYKIAQKEIDKYCRKNKIRFPVILTYDGMRLKV